MNGRKAAWKTEKRLNRRKSGHVVERECFRDLQDIETSSSPSPTLLRNHPSCYSPSRSLLCSRLSQKPDTFNYEVISVTEEKRENSTEEESHETTELKTSNKVREKNDGFSNLYASLKSKLVKPKFSLDIETEWRNLDCRELLPKFTLKSDSRYCNRALLMKNSDITKHFCDVFGPQMCNDCTKARKKQASVEDFVESFPDITISPFSLCVAQENPDGKVKTLPTAYKDCDPLFRRRTANFRVFSWHHDPCRVPATRPNSSVSRESCSLSLEDSSPSLLTPTSSRPHSRPSSLPRHIESINDDIRRLESSEDGMEFRDVQTNKGVKVMAQSAKSRKGPKAICEGHPSDLQQNVFHKAISARTSGARSSRTPAFERRGKLSELPYWKFMIPEPPIMEVGRMNVSIYTPKDIPGIKIFDESLFDI